MESIHVFGEQEANRREYLRPAAVKRDAAAGEAMYRRARDNPDDNEITSGDALNAILDQLTNPKISNSALRLIKTPISGQAIREIPFENASEAVTLCLAELTGDEGWPPALQTEIFAPEPRPIGRRSSRRVKEDEEGELSPRTLEEVDREVSRLRPGSRQIHRPIAASTRRRQASSRR